MTDERTHVLNSIWQDLAPMFPDGAYVTRILDSRENFFITWPLADQPEHLTQASRNVSIYFAEEFLRDFPSFDTETRQRAAGNLRRVVKACMVGFDDGRSTARGAMKEALIIKTTTDELLDK